MGSWPLWPWPLTTDLAWTLCLSMVITPENFRMIRGQEYCLKGVTDGQTDRQTEISVLTAAWSLKNTRQTHAFISYTLNISVPYMIRYWAQCNKEIPITLFRLRTCKGNPHTSPLLGTVLQNILYVYNHTSVHVIAGYQALGHGKGGASLMFHELPKMFSPNLWIAEIVLLMRISSWNFVLVLKAMLGADVQSLSLKFSK